jgi:hypothetical protein
MADQDLPVYKTAGSAVGYTHAWRCGHCDAKVEPGKAHGVEDCVRSIGDRVKALEANRG